MFYKGVIESPVENFQKKGPAQEEKTVLVGSGQLSIGELNRNKPALEV